MKTQASKIERQQEEDDRVYVLANLCSTQLRDSQYLPEEQENEVKL